MERVILKIISKIVFLSILIMLIWCYSGSVGKDNLNQKKDHLSWEEVKELVDLFLNNPTKEYFQMVEENVFSKIDKDAKQFPQWIETLLRYCLWGEESSWIVEYEMFAGNLYVAKFNYYLLHISDGVYAEDLAENFGKLIRINPKLFLQIFKEETTKDYIDSVIGCSIFEETDLYKKYERYDLEKRIEALKSVSDPELKPIRDYCISVLERSLL